MTLGNLTGPAFMIAWRKVLNAPLDIRTAYSVKRLNDELKGELKRLEEMRQDLVAKYADKDEDGKPLVEGNIFKFSGDNKTKFEQSYEGLLKLELELEGKYTTIKVEELEKAQVQLTAVDLEALIDLIEMPEAQKPTPKLPLKPAKNRKTSN